MFVISKKFTLKKLRFKICSMNSYKDKINKIILGLTSFGVFFLLILPASLYGNHFRYGTMSWEPISDNGTHVTVRLKMENGWTANH